LSRGRLRIAPVEGGGGGAGGIRICGAERGCAIPRAQNGLVPELQSVRELRAPLKIDVGIVVDVYELRFSFRQQVSQRRTTGPMSSSTTYRVYHPLGFIHTRITRRGRVEKGAVQRLPRNSIGTIWHAAVIPVVDVLHSVILI